MLSYKRKGVSMARSHYEVLGVGKGATQSEIRSAYRKLVLQYHPDRSSEAGALQQFLSITQAYEVLGDWDRRVQYDKLLEVRAASASKVASERARPKPYAATGKAGRSTVVSAEVTRLTLLHSRGQSSTAEKLAHKILGYDSHQPIPYAVLGDISRAQGRLREAAKMYALAVQMDPSNELYQQRHEELLGHSVAPGRPQLGAKGHQISLMVGVGVIFLAAIYLMVSLEQPLMPQLAAISTWTLGVVVMSFLSGVALGASMSYGNHIDRFFSVATSSLGRVTPVVALATVAIVNFWVAAGLYAVLGALQRGFNYSTTRVVMAVAATTLFLSLASHFSSVIDGGQTLLWAGNLIYVGSLCGWMVADSMRA